MRSRQIAIAGGLVILVAAGVAQARDPNKVRCRTASEDGAVLKVEYEAERRLFRADFSATPSERDFEDRWRSSDFRDASFASPYAPGDVLQVTVAGQMVGTIVLDRNLTGRLRFDEAAEPRGRRSAGDDQPFPANFPPFPPGTVTSAGTLSCTGQRR